MTKGNATRSALAGADRLNADRIRDRQHDIRYYVERRDRPGRQRLVAIYNGVIVGHTRLRGDRWHVYTPGQHEALIGLGSAILALRNAIMARSGQS